MSNERLPLDRRALLSYLWTFLMFNYLYADVLGLMDASVLRQYLSGTVDTLTLTPQFLLAAAVLMEIPIAMTVLARILPRRVNRWANIGAGVVSTIAVAGSLTVGTPSIYYLFFALIEIPSTLLIIAFAWWWPRDPSGPLESSTTNAAEPRR